MNNSDQQPLGCLAFLFGVRANPEAGGRGPVAGNDSDMGEGEIHSGPGGYEGMGYSGGYAADYFDDDEGEER